MSLEFGMNLEQNLDEITEAEAPECNKEKLKELLNLMNAARCNTSLTDVVLLDSKDIKFIEKQDRFNINKNTLAKLYYNHIDYISATPKKRTTNIYFTQKLKIDDIVDYLSADYDISSKEGKFGKKTIFSKKGKPVFDLLRNRLAVHPKPFDKDYNENLNNIVDAITLIQDSVLLYGNKTINFYEYRPALMIFIPDYHNPEYLRQCVDSLYHFKTSKQSKVPNPLNPLESKNISDIVRTTRKNKDNFVISTDNLNRHIKYVLYVGDEDRVVVRLLSDISIDEISKRLSSVFQFQSNNGEWKNLHENPAEYNIRIKQALDENKDFNTRKLPGTFLLQNTEYASCPIGMERNFLKLEDKRILYVDKHNIEFFPRYHYSDYEFNVAKCVANEIYSQMLFSTQTHKTPRKNVMLYKDEREICKSVYLEALERLNRNPEIYGTIGYALIQVQVGIVNNILNDIKKKAKKL